MTRRGKGDKKETAVAANGDKKRLPAAEPCHQSGAAWLRELCDKVSLDWFMGL